MKLRHYLEEKGLSQKAFAVRIGRSQQAVSRYCNDKAPDAATARLIVTATDGAVTPNDFHDLPGTRQHEQGAAA